MQHGVLSKQGWVVAMPHRLLSRCTEAHRQVTRRGEGGSA